MSAGKIWEIPETEAAKGFLSTHLRTLQDGQQDCQSTFSFKRTMGA